MPGNLNIIIRPEISKDLPGIFALHKIVFGQDNEAILVDALRRTGAFIPNLSLVAISGDQIVGHILFTRIQVGDETGNTSESLALAPMAVKPGFQKMGIGAKLIRTGLEKAKEEGFKSVIVLGHEHYYPKFGFQPAEKWNIRLSFKVPPNVFMAIELVNGGLNNVSGTVIYPKEFDAV